MSKLRSARLHLFILFAFATAGYSAPTRRSLSIGNDSYPGNVLQNARNDARGVSAALSALGYVSTLVLDVDREKLSYAIAKFSGTIAPGDMVVIYYSGHGLQVAGENYLVPTDFRVTDSVEVASKAYALSSLLTLLIEHGARTQVIILDSCRDNPFFHTRSTGSGWATVSASAGTFLAFGTAPGATASDNPAEDHGSFTKALLAHLAETVEINSMFEAIREDVIVQSHGAQVPWTASSLIGSLHLNDSGRAFSASITTSREPSTSERSAIGYAKSVPFRSTSEQVDVPTLDRALEQAKGLHFQQALQIIDTLLSTNPGTSVAFRLLGLILHHLGRDNDAKRAFDHALAADPLDALALSYRCLVMESTSATLAEADCRQALQLKRDLPQSHVGLAISLELSGHSVEAVTQATEAITLAPTSPIGFAARGAIESREGHAEMAGKDFAEANRRASSHP